MDINFAEKWTTQVIEIIIFIFINSEKLGRRIRKPKDKITVALLSNFSVIMFKILPLKERTQSVSVIFYNSFPQTQEETLTFYTE